MNILDDKKVILEFDKDDTLSSIDNLDKQISYTVDKVRDLSMPPEYKQAKNIIFTGMGGSSYAGRLIKSLFGKSLGIPLDFFNSYNLPGYATASSLVIAATYSGATEEVLSCTEEALELNCPLIGVTHGGKLKEMLDLALKPVFTFTQDFNPSMQPRLGQGYMIFSQLGILNSLGYLDKAEINTDKIIQNTNRKRKELTFTVLNENNLAKKMAERLFGKQVNLITGPELEGGIHVFRNTLHETGKHFANYYLVPELNHHLLEGLSYPEGIGKTQVFLFADSPFFSEKIRQRLSLTKEIIQKQGFETADINLSLSDLLTQNIELIQFGSYTAFYLAMLHKVNPAKIEWVDYFKNSLSKLQNINKL